jgi:hypothetical protein
MQAQDASLALGAGAQEITIGGSTTVVAQIADVRSLHAYSISVAYDPAVLRCASVRVLRFLGSSSFYSSRVDSVAGVVHLEEAILGPTGKSGSGDLIEVTFGGKGAGSSALLYSLIDLRDTLNNALPFQATGGQLSVAIPVAVARDAVPVGSLLTVANYPNPFNGTTRFVIHGVPSGLVRLSVYSILGELIWSQESHQHQGGLVGITWDGVSGVGRPAPSGVYLVRAETAGQRVTRRIVLMR